MCGLELVCCGKRKQAEQPTDCFQRSVEGELVLMSAWWQHEVGGPSQAKRAATTSTPTSTIALERGEVVMMSDDGESGGSATRHCTQGAEVLLVGDGGADQQLQGLEGGGRRGADGRRVQFLEESIVYEFATPASEAENGVVEHTGPEPVVMSSSTPAVVLQCACVLRNAVGVHSVPAIPQQTTTTTSEQQQQQQQGAADWAIQHLACTAMMMHSAGSSSGGSGIDAMCDDNGPLVASAETMAAEEVAEYLQCSGTCRVSVDEPADPPPSPTSTLTSAATTTTSTSGGTAAAAMACRIVSVATKQTDGPSWEAVAFDKLVLGYLEKRVIKSVGDILAMFRDDALILTLASLTQRCSAVLEILTEVGHVGLLPSAVKLTPVMVPHVKHLRSLCEAALHRAAEQELAQTGIQLHELAAALQTEGLRVY